MRNPLLGALIAAIVIAVIVKLSGWQPETTTKVEGLPTPGVTLATEEPFPAEAASGVPETKLTISLTDPNWGKIELTAGEGVWPTFTRPCPPGIRLGRNQPRPPKEEEWYLLSPTLAHTNLTCFGQSSAVPINPGSAISVEATRHWPKDSLTEGEEK